MKLKLNYKRYVKYIGKKITNTPSPWGQKLESSF